MKIKRALALLLALVLTVTATLPASAASTNVSAWAQADITEAAQAGIVPGDLPTDYTQPITRAQFCNIAVKLYETVRGAAITGRSEFTDTTDVNVQKMAYLGVVGGYGGGIFGPNDTLTREQAAAILSRLAGQLNISMRTVAIPYTDVATSWARADIVNVYSIEVMTGTSSTTFDPSMHYTIEQSIVTMLRLYKKTVSIIPDTSRPNENQAVNPSDPNKNQTTSPSIPNETQTTTPSIPDETQTTASGIIASGTCDDGLTWVLDSDGQLSISGTGEMMNYDSKRPPWYSRRTRITSVIIGEGVTTLSNYALWNCTNMVSVSLPETLISIGNSTFHDCVSLSSVNIPKSVTSIGSNAFYNCSTLTSINIPENVTSLGAGAFLFCSSLTELTIPGDIINAENAFPYDPKGSCYYPLEKVTMPSMLTYTFDSLDDVKGFAETLYTTYPLYLGIYVPAKQAAEFAAELTCYGSPGTVGDNFSANKPCIARTIPLKNSEYVLIILSFRYYDNMDILPYHQGYLKELSQDSIPLYERAKTILSTIITDDMSEYQKVKAIHDYLVKNTTYVSGAANAHNPKGPILDGKSVCEGYAEALQLLCVMSDIDCLYVEGVIKSGFHAWNKVKVDGTWYNADVTWDDPTGGSLRHTYFLISDSKLAKDHTWTKTYLPATRSNYSK